ncbi:serine/threonine-protein phosphatase [Nocardioides jishulii]|uniref:Serine/threonine-protein phosphatase n=1 Tax=Nocardioides jishulii TaxID=2575440 RepID=A0A4U2YUV7_9ACTN|nr:serine/threonine-protein phosphatase [Nocardioides jishulii]TKI64874.1 serine/threonine-protein phosphatase [Nocardioides jishulii]
MRPDADGPEGGNGALRLHWSALSDVGRVRKDNQDSGYAGPWLLLVCDGVGGAARGDVASSTAVQVLRRLDEPSSEDLLERLAGALHRAHDRIAELAEEDQSLDGTSTTATVGLFDGQSLGLGHVGDSRAYLLRDGELSQLTHDHTFVQGLVDEGRITDDEARVHPHRNLILKALDGVRDPAPDLFTVALSPGDRLLFCSDGASGVLDDERLGAILGQGTPDFATVELVRASLEAGSTDNVTCVVADVVPASDAPVDADPLLVGAAADLPRTAGAPLGEATVKARTPRSSTALPDGASGAIATDPLDVEAVRYAPRAPHRFAWLRALLVVLTLAGVTWVVGVGAWWWTQHQFFVGEDDGVVTIYRGVDTTLPGGFELFHPYETTDVVVDGLSDYDAQLVQDGIAAADLEAARTTVDNLAAQQFGE